MEISRLHLFLALLTLEQFGYRTKLIEDGDDSDGDLRMNNACISLGISTTTIFIGDDRTTQILMQIEIDRKQDDGSLLSLFELDPTKWIFATSLETKETIRDAVNLYRRSNPADNAFLRILATALLSSGDQSIVDFLGKYGIIITDLNKQATYP